MKERPILFSGEMVRAILDGRKTQTRRIVKPSSGIQSGWLTEDLLNSVPHGELINGGWQMYHPMSGKVIDGVHIEHNSPLGWIKCPHGSIGDQLWVREAWHTDEPDLKEARSMHEDVYSRSPIYYRTDPENDDGGCRWRPSIHMPRWASRIQLEITGIRVERLKPLMLFTVW